MPWPCQRGYSVIILWRYLADSASCLYRWMDECRGADIKAIIAEASQWYFGKYAPHNIYSTEAKHYKMATYLYSIFVHFAQYCVTLVIRLSCQKEYQCIRENEYGICAAQIPHIHFQKNMWLRLVDIGKCTLKSVDWNSVAKYNALASTNVFTHQGVFQNESRESTFPKFVHCNCIANGLMQSICSVLWMEKRKTWNVFNFWSVQI